MTKKEVEVFACRYLLQSLGIEGVMLRPNEIEDSDVDVYAEYNGSVINFQVVTSSGPVYKAAHDNSLLSKRNQKMAVIEPLDQQWILQALAKKEIYTTEAKRKLILVIDGGYPALSISEAGQLRIPPTEFSGVYLVRLPTEAYPPSLEAEGFIATLKKSPLLE